MFGVEAIFGVAASGAGLISLSIQLFESANKLRRFYHAAQDAPKTISALVSDLEIMAMFLQQLEHHRQQGTPAEALVARCILRCQHSTAEVQHLVDKMQLCMEKHARLGGKLYSAFKQRDVKDLLDGVERAKSSLHLAYTMYQHQAHGDMLAMLQAQILAGKGIGSQQSTSLVQSSTSSHNAGHLMIPASQRLSADCTNVPRTNSVGNWESVLGTRQDERFTRTRGRRDSEARFRAKFRLPTWICRRVFHFAIIQAQCGWSMYLRTYNVLPDGALIFRLCRSGNLAGVRRLIEGGAASPLDVVGDWTLLDVSLLPQCRITRQPRGQADTL